MKQIKLEETGFTCSLICTISNLSKIENSGEMEARAKQSVDKETRNFDFNSRGVVLYNHQ